MYNIEAMVYPENGGWVYTDNNWENPRNGNSVSLSETSTLKNKSVTRRRRWIRKCELDLSRKYSLSDL